MHFKTAKKILHRHSIALRKTVKHFNGVMLVKDPELKLRVCIEKELPEHQKIKKLKAGKKLRSDDKKATEDELEVDYIVVGKIQANLIRTSKWFPTPGAPGGVSIGHEDVTAGTLGCSVFDACGRFILSCNHVLADCNDGSVGDDIYQPGAADGGTVADKIGELHSYVTIDFWDVENPDVILCNEVDAALCLPTEDSYITNGIIEDDMSTEYSPDGLGDWQDTFDNARLVKMSGRTSGVTTGYILGYGNFWVGYGDARYAYFTCQIVTTPIAAGGDSGSLLIDNVTSKAIGLCFAGSDCITLFNDACYIAEAFGITFYPEAGRKVVHIPLTGRAVTVTDGFERKVVIHGSPVCDECPCNPVECDSPDCEEHTPKHITVTLSGIERYTDCCPADGLCDVHYPLPDTCKYTYDPNQSFVLEQTDVPGSCEWFLAIPNFVAGICYNLENCTGDENTLTFTENAIRVTRQDVGEDKKVTIEAIFGGHNVIIGDTLVVADCVNCSIDDDDQDPATCNSIYSRGTATISGLLDAV